MSKKELVFWYAICATGVALGYLGVGGMLSLDGALVFLLSGFVLLIRAGEIGKGEEVGQNE